MKRYFFLLILLGSFTPRFLPAQPQASPAVPNNRFLFVVENSAAMSRSAKAAQETVRELIKSGVQGEMRAGDTFSVWTYDDQLNTTFPVQTWLPNTSELQALSSEDFLRQHRYKNKGQLSVALPKVYSLIKASKSITVILVTTGTEPMRGTPFDKEMNMIYPQYSKELRDAKIPFVTVLIGFGGRPVAFSINSSLGPIHIPQPPLKPKTAPVETNLVVTATNEAPAQATNKTAPAKVEVKPDAIAIVPDVAKVESKEVVAAASTSAASEIATPVPTETKSTKTPAIIEAEPPKVSSDSSIKTIVASPAEPAEKIESKPVVTESAPDSAPNLATATPTDLIGSEPTPPEPLLPPAPAAPVVATQSLSTAKLLLLAGAVLLLVAAVLIYLLVRHYGKSQPSLISHSIDRKK